MIRHITECEIGSVDCRSSSNSNDGEIEKTWSLAQGTSGVWVFFSVMRYQDPTVGTDIEDTPVVRASG